jgi:hypothetical protein
MSNSGQRFVVQFPFLKGLGAKAIQRKLTAILGSTHTRFGCKAIHIVAELE